MRNSFIEALNANQKSFGVSLSDDSVIQLADYYELILEHNTLLHLVAPCPPEEFATRHVLESLTMLEHLPKGAKFVDIGSGGGVPAIPCLLVRKDLHARLIESKEKKAYFLSCGVKGLRMNDRAVVINRQFAETDPGDSDHVTCRAIERFPERLSQILRWSKGRKFLFFGGEALGGKLDTLKVPYSQHLLPLSERRYLFVSQN